MLFKSGFIFYTDKNYRCWGVLKRGHNVVFSCTFILFSILGWNVNWQQNVYLREKNYGWVNYQVARDDYVNQTSPVQIKISVGANVGTDANILPSLSHFFLVWDHEAQLITHDILEVVLMWSTDCVWLIIPFVVKPIAIDCKNCQDIS
jgi:hypothetical protein